MSSKQLSAEMQRLKSSVEKIEAIEDMTEAVRNIQGRMDEYKMIISDFKSLSERVDNMHANINQKMQSSPIVDNRQIEQLKSEIWKKLDEQRAMIQGRASKEDFNLLKQKMDTMQVSGGGVTNSGSEKDLARLKEDVKNAVMQAQEPISVLNIQMSDMLGKLIALEMRISNAEKLLEKHSRMQPVVIE